jgi:hypothetical protein
MARSNEMRKLSLRHFNGHFLVTRPRHGAGQVQHAPASTGLVRHPDLPIKEDRPGSKRLPGKKPASPTDER